MTWKHTNALSGTVRKPKSCATFFMFGALAKAPNIKKVAHDLGLRTVPERALVCFHVI